MSEEAGTTIPGEREEQARAQGWSPKEEWRGPEDKWVDAETFLKRGEEIAPVMRERNKHLTRDIAEMKQLLQIQHQSIAKAREQGYRQAIEELNEKQREAVRNADEEAFDAAERKKAKILKAYDEEHQAQQPQIDPVFIEWCEDNEWYQNDPDLAAYADGIGPRVARESGMSGKKLLDEVAKRVKKTFHHKFANPRRSEASAVEPSAATLTPKKGKTFESLPPEAKKNCDRFMKIIPGFTREDYLADYDWE